MRDVREHIRQSMPDPDTLAAIDVDLLKRRGRRRRRIARALTGLAMLVMIGFAAAGIAHLPFRGESRIEFPAPAATDSESLAPPAPTSPSTPTPPDQDAGQGTILAQPTPGDAAPGSPGGPASGACGAEGAPDGIATVAIGPDIPAPRCIQVLPGQRVRVTNATRISGEVDEPGETIIANLGDYRFQLAPGETVVLDLPVSSYLEPGIHRIESSYGPAAAEIWVLQAPSASLGQQVALDALLAFARDPSLAAFQRLPLADDVALGTAERLVIRRAADALRDPAAWEIDSGASALDALGREVQSAVLTVGVRPHCDGAMPPAPAEVANLTRLSIQPPIRGSCDGWFAVDVYVDDDGMGEIHAVTLDAGP